MPVPQLSTLLHPTNLPIAHFAIQRDAVFCNLKEMSVEMGKSWPQEQYKNTEVVLWEII